MDSWHGTITIPGGCESPCHQFDAICDRDTIHAGCMYPGYPADECPGHYTDYSDLACSGPEIPYSYTGNWVNYHAFADPIHSEAVVTRVNAAIKGMLFQKEPFQTELNQFSFYLNNELIQAFKAPNTTTYPRSHSNMSCTPSTPYNTVRC